MNIIEVLCLTIERLTRTQILGEGCKSFTQLPIIYIYLSKYVGKNGETHLPYNLKRLILLAK